MRGFGSFLTRWLPPSLAAEVSSPFFLTFRDADRERAYRDDHFTRSLGQLRAALALGIAMYAAFGVLDGYLIPDVAQTAWLIRYALVVPLASLVLALSYTRHFRAMMEATTALVMFVASLGIVAMVAIAEPPGNYLYYAGLLLVVTFMMTFLRPRFPIATALAWITFLLYEITAVWGGRVPTTILVSNTVFFAAFTVVAMLANYTLESLVRSDFLQRQVIQDQARRLEENLFEVELRRREAEAHAQIDSLTGLYNRRHFFAMLDYACNRDRRTPRELSVLLMDLDHFKHVNDTFGHLVGDEVLQSVAQIMRFGIRQGDVPCRYGGEEFAILLPQASLTVATMVGERLREILERTTIPTDKGPILITTSVGVASLADDEEGFEALLERADGALYTAKREGRNQVRVASATDPATRALPLG